MRLSNSHLRARYRERDAETKVELTAGICVPNDKGEYVAIVVVERWRKMGSGRAGGPRDPLHVLQLIPLCS
jgi:hypothetical protein